MTEPRHIAALATLAASGRAAAPENAEPAGKNELQVYTVSLSRRMLTISLIQQTGTATRQQDTEQALRFISCLGFLESSGLLEEDEESNAAAPAPSTATPEGHTEVKEEGEEEADDESKAEFLFKTIGKLWESGEGHGFDKEGEKLEQAKKESEGQDLEAPANAPPAEREATHAAALNVPPAAVEEGEKTSEDSAIEEKRVSEPEASKEGEEAAAALSKPPSEMRKKDDGVEVFLAKAEKEKISGLKEKENWNKEALGTELREESQAENIQEEKVSSEAEDGDAAAHAAAGAPVAAVLDGPSVDIVAAEDVNPHSDEPGGSGVAIVKPSKTQGAGEGELWMYADEGSASDSSDSSNSDAEADGRFEAAAADPSQPQANPLMDAFPGRAVFLQVASQGKDRTLMLACFACLCFAHNLGILGKRCQNCVLGVYLQAGAVIDESR